MHRESSRASWGTGPCQGSRLRFAWQGLRLGLGRL